MVTRGKWEVAGPDPETTNPNTGQWGIEADSGAWIASHLTFDDAKHLVELHNKSVE